jgi:hypothetical protein
MVTKMTTHLSPLLERVARFAPVSLEDLKAEAEFLTRRDRKYLVPVDRVGEVIDEIDQSARVLEIDGRRCFDYVTPYFDTNVHAAYLGALRRRPNRFKVRTRLYVDSGLCLLEVKLLDARGRTVKHRVLHDADRLTKPTTSEQEWLRGFPQVAPHVDELQHCMTTRYHRITLALPDGAGRVTLDRDLAFSRPDGEVRALRQYVVIETKGPGGPTSVDRLLWWQGFRPASISKFACGMSLLHPELPANRWHRLRNRLETGQDLGASTQPVPAHVDEGAYMPLTVTGGRVSVVAGLLGTAW